MLCKACRITGWSPQLQMEYSNDPLYSVSGKWLLSIRHLNLFPGPFYFFVLSLYITIHHSSPYTYCIIYCVKDSLYILLLTEVKLPCSVLITRWMGPSNIENSVCIKYYSWLYIKNEGSIMPSISKLV